MENCVYAHPQPPPWPHVGGQIIAYLCRLLQISRKFHLLFRMNTEPNLKVMKPLMGTRNASRSFLSNLMTNELWKVRCRPLLFGGDLFSLRRYESKFMKSEIRDFIAIFEISLYWFANLHWWKTFLFSSELWAIKSGIERWGAELQPPFVL